MKYTTEPKRLKPVLDLARKLDIATNPAPEALFEAGNCGFSIWCTPEDLAWAKEKIRWLFQQAEISCTPVWVEKE